MAEVFSGNIGVYRDENASVYEDIFSSLPETASEKKKEIIDEIQMAVFGEGRLNGLDATIDGRVSLIGNNYAISLNAFDLGKDMPESISIGIINVNKDDLTLKHRYSRERQEIEIETKSREDIKMLSFAEVTDTLVERGMELTHVEGSDAAYRIVGPDDVAHGELIGMRGEGGDIEGAYINNFHTGDFLTVENEEQLDEIFKLLIPEKTRDNVELNIAEEEMEVSFEDAEPIEIDPEKEVEKLRNKLEPARQRAIERGKKEMNLEGDRPSDDSDKKPEIDDKTENHERSTAKKMENTMPELNDGMSEREMREACINFINKGAEPSQEQLDFINGKGERDSVEIKEEIDFLKAQKEQIKEEIERNEKKLEALNKDLGRHIAFAKDNGCESVALDNIRQDLNYYQKTTQSLDNKREALANIELRTAELRAEKNRALSREMAQSLRGKFQAAQDTLKKGVEYGINTIDKVKNTFERVNGKVADMKDIHERKAAYASLSSEIDAVNKEYILQISEVRKEYDRNLQMLNKAMDKAKRQAMLKGAFKDLCRIALHKEPEYDYSLSDKQQGKINDIKDMIQENREEMRELNAEYEDILPKMENELNSIASGLEAKGIDAGRSVLSGIAETRAERNATAKELLENSKKEASKTSRDDDYER
nr:hypothetical protein [uncultured Butyrivibrio sp.]